MPSHSQMKQLTALRMAKYRQKYGQFVVEGRKAVEEVFHSGWEVLGIWCTMEFAEKYNPLYSFEVMDELESKKLTAFETSPGVIAWVKMPENRSLNADCDFILALDGISDPGNLGTIIRLADWYGLNQILVSNDTVDAFNPKVLAASMGSFLRVNVVYGDLVGEIRRFQKSFGIAGVLGADLQGDSIYKMEFPSKAMLVMGSESHGLRTDVRDVLGRYVTIPKHGFAESLNAGIATAILMDNFLQKMQNFARL